MISQTAVKKSRQPARAKGNDPRSLKRKRGVDELASLKKAVEELVCRSLANSTEQKLTSLGSQRRIRGILWSAIIGANSQRIESLAFFDSHWDSIKGHTTCSKRPRHTRRSEDWKWKNTRLSNSCFRKSLQTKMEFGSWFRRFNHITYKRARRSNIRGSAKNWTVPLFLCRSGNRW